MDKTYSLFWFSGGLFIIVLVVCFICLSQLRKKDTSGNTSHEPRILFEEKILNFAYLFIFGLILVFLEAMAMYYWSESPTPGSFAGKEIFDSCKTIIPPFVSLVIGYFFGKKAN
jgi:heme/copper-type cytochrome/quinol oxidase subunit 2